MQAIKSVSRSWYRSLATLLGSAQRDLIVCSPFVARKGTQFIGQHVTSVFQAAGHLTLLTNLSVANVCQMATDPRALESLVGSVSASVVYHLPGLHAKVYIADDECAIVTSGNLTYGGLFANYEYGLQVTERRLVRQIRKDILDFAHLGAVVPHVSLSAYCVAIESVYEAIRHEQASVQASLRERYRASLRPIEDHLLRLRLAGGSLHAVFARTIEYLLRTHGALKTVELHPMVASLHPDLCDDSVDRVIDGKRFGKKWKHAVRTAQQQLKKQGSIAYENGTWRLVNKQR